MSGLDPAPARALLRRLITAHFRELTGLRIAIGFEPLSGGDLLYCAFENGACRIGIHDALAGAPRRVLAGGIAHELAHISHDSGLGAFARDLAFEKYARLRAFRIRDERRAELQVIERGLGDCLLAFLRHARRLGCEFTPEHGLLPREAVKLVRMRRRAARRNCGGPSLPAQI